MIKALNVLLLSLSISPIFSQIGDKEIELNSISQYNKDLKNNWDTYLGQGGDWHALFERKEYAFDCRNIFIVEYLVHLGKLKVDYEMDSAYTPFSHGCLCGSKYLVNKGLEYDVEVNRLYQNNMSALMLTIKSGDLDNFNLLLKKNPNINQINNEGNNALILALHNSKNIDFVKKLLSLGADIHSRDKQLNYNSFELAFWKGREDTFEYLLQYCLEKKDSLTIQKSSVLKMAIFSGDTTYAKKLLPICELKKSNLKNVDYVNSAGDFAELYNLLNKHRGNPPDTTSSLYSTKDLDISVFNILVEYGYDINVLDSLGQNVLFKCRNIDAVVRYLVGKNININCIDKSEKTVLEYYIDEIIKPETVNINGEEVSTESNDDYKLQIDLLKFYIENKAFVGKRQENGWKYIYDQAIKFNNPHLKKYLESKFKKELKEVKIF